MLTVRTTCVCLYRCEKYVDIPQPYCHLEQDPVNPCCQRPVCNFLVGHNQIEGTNTIPTTTTTQSTTPGYWERKPASSLLLTPLVTIRIGCQPFVDACLLLIIIIMEVISIAPYLTDKGEHTALLPLLLLVFHYFPSTQPFFLMKRVHISGCQIYTQNQNTWKVENNV